MVAPFGAAMTMVATPTVIVVVGIPMILVAHAIVIVARHRVSVVAAHHIWPVIMAIRIALVGTGHVARVGLVMPIG